MADRPETLAILVAEFERSGVGRLILTGPTFELVLRAGKAPRWTERDPAPQSLNK